MRQIIKGTEPSTLTRYRSSLTREQQLSEKAYDDFPNKTKVQCDANQRGNLRKKLLEDQGYICCYCMARISCQNSKIEHFSDQSTNRNLQLNFSNLYIACEGNEGQRLNKQHCDTHKGSSNLNYVNFTRRIENDIKYNPSGKIFSDISDLDDDIKNVLNLNYEILVKNRQIAYEVFIKRMKSKYGNTREWRRRDIIHEITKYSSKDSSGKYKVFCQMFIYFLKKKEAQL